MLGIFVAAEKFYCFYWEKHHGRAIAAATLFSDSDSDSGDYSIEEDDSNADFIPNHNTDILFGGLSQRSCLFPHNLKEVHIDNSHLHSFVKRFSFCLLIDIHSDIGERVSE